MKKPVVAVTGTVGKTTVTHLLSEYAKEFGLRVWTGGNIGVGMLELLKVKDNVDLAILEISSFQLEHCTTFAPDLAVWTNIQENHLDRHGTMKHYFAAKKKIVDHQSPTQYALLSSTLKVLLQNAGLPQSKICYVSHNLPPFIFSSQNKQIIRHLSAQLPTTTFQENKIIVAAALTQIAQMFNKDLKTYLPQAVSIPPHRLEHVGQHNGVTFYNDSKATTPSATIAAVKHLSNNPIILLLGGLSKGVDRAHLVAQIKPYVKQVCTFGKEAESLKHFCLQKKIPCSAHENLEKAFSAGVACADRGDQILLSPAGASFDLFKNYEERGNRFKQLVTSLIANN